VTLLIPPPTVALPSILLTSPIKMSGEGPSLAENDVKVTDFE
jgi:hypothetical protein